MIKFDNDGTLIVQEINKKIIHDGDHERLYEREKTYERKSPYERELPIGYKKLVSFIFNYCISHVYVSKRMVSGLYIIKYNELYSKTDITAFQKNIMRKVSSIFHIWEKLGICRKHGQKTMKIDRDKLKEFTLKDIC